MNVTIKFHGLCMFVEQGGIVYVLLPKAHGDMAGVPAHSAALIYDGRLDDPPHDYFHFQPLEGKELVFEGLDGSSASITWGKGLVDYTKYAQVKVHRDHLTKEDKLAGRVKLEHGAAEGTGKCACWNIRYRQDGQWLYEDVSLTDVVTVTATIPGDKLRWGVRALGKTGDPSEWITVNGTSAGQIDLEIHHLTADPDDKEPSANGPAKHYAAYLQLLRPGNKAELPTYGKLGECGSSLTPEEEEEIRRSPTVFTCMVAGGTP